MQQKWFQVISLTWYFQQVKGQSAFFFKFTARKYKLVQKGGFKDLKTQFFFYDSIDSHI